MKTEAQLLKDFEDKFGFTTYEALRGLMGNLYQKILDLEKSRNNWRNKYEELKKKQ